MKKKKTAGRCKKRNVGLVETAEPEYVKRAPHSFVIHRGQVGPLVKELVFDWRRVMEPFTASNLKVRKSNTLKDLVAVAGTFHVSHLVSFSRGLMSVNMKLARLPSGPTLTFRVPSYSLSRDVASTTKKQAKEVKRFLNSPLLVLNNFQGEGLHLKLMASMFQNMFPTINVAKTKLDSIRRCVLMNYNTEDGQIDVRHYSIKVQPTGMNRNVKKIVTSKVPDLGALKDVADLIDRAGGSESEGELEKGEEVVLPDSLGSRGNVKGRTSAVKLIETGPRLTLKLLKVESGLFEGDVLYHDIVTKTEEEKEKLLQQREKKRKEKLKRQRIQEQNLKKKAKEKEKQKKTQQKGEKEESEEEDDREWYKSEIGENPDSDLFSKPESRKQIRLDKNTSRVEKEEEESSERRKRKRKFSKGGTDNPKKRKLGKSHKKSILKVPKTLHKTKPKKKRRKNK